MMDRVKALRNPAESEQVQAVATAVAELEHDLHDALQAHYDALDADPPEDLMAVEDRVDQIGQLVEAQMNGNLWEYFVAEQAPDALEAPEKAQKHAGKAPDEWEETVAGWADGLRQQLDGVEDVPDRDLADRFCQQRFGVDLETFEAAVVEWSPGRTMRLALRGRVDADIQRLEAATAALEAADETPDVDLAREE